MTNPYRRLVESKLSQCGQLLELVDQVKGQGRLEQTLLESALLHLGVALRFFSAELVYEVSPEDVDGQLNRFYQKASVTPQLACLMRLEQQLWAITLRSYLAQLQTLSDTVTPVSSRDSSDDLIASDISRSPGAAEIHSKERILSLIRAFRQYSDVERGGLLEY